MRTTGYKTARVVGPPRVWYTFAVKSREGNGRNATVVGASPKRSGVRPRLLADAGHTPDRKGVSRMKKRLYVRIAAVAASMAGLLLAGGAGFGVK
jgi:hypothetical protein